MLRGQKEDFSFRELTNGTVMILNNVEVEILAFIMILTGGSK